MRPRPPAVAGVAVGPANATVATTADAAIATAPAEVANPHRRDNFFIYCPSPSGSDLFRFAYRWRRHRQGFLRRRGQELEETWLTRRR